MAPVSQPNRQDGRCCCEKVPETNMTSPLKMDGWNTILLLLGQKAYFQVLLLLVSGRIFIFNLLFLEGTQPSLMMMLLPRSQGCIAPGPGNLGWPVRAQFWDSYKGHLTPLGAKLLTDTGGPLRWETCVWDDFQENLSWQNGEYWVIPFFGGVWLQLL